jgi:hypothetical protein
VVAISGHEEAMKQAGVSLSPSVPLLGKPFTADELLTMIDEQIRGDKGIA